MAKVTARIWEHEEGSDDPRAIEGGGGPRERWVETRTNSLWLIKRYVDILNIREGGFSFSVAKATGR